MNQLGQEFAVMNYFEFSSQPRVLVLESVETMRACGHHLFDPVKVQRRYVLTGKLLEEEFVSYAARGITAALFFAPQNGKLYPRGFEQVGSGAGDFLIAID